MIIVLSIIYFPFGVQFPTYFLSSFLLCCDATQANPSSSSRISTRLKASIQVSKLLVDSLSTQGNQTPIIPAVVDKKLGFLHSNSDQTLHLTPLKHTQKSPTKMSPRPHTLNPINISTTEINNSNDVISTTTILTAPKQQPHMDLQSKSQQQTQQHHPTPSEKLVALQPLGPLKRGTSSNSGVTAGSGIGSMSTSLNRSFARNMAVNRCVCCLLS